MDNAMNNPAPAATENTGIEFLAALRMLKVNCRTKPSTGALFQKRNCHQQLNIYFFGPGSFIMNIMS